jgi:hypothetical protein
MDAVPPARIRNIVEESQTSLGPSNVVDYRASVIQVDRKSAISPIRLVDHILWGIMKIRESFEERPQEMILPWRQKQGQKSFQTVGTIFDNRFQVVSCVTHHGSRAPRGNRWGPGSVGSPTREKSKLRHGFLVSLHKR